MPIMTGTALEFENMAKNKPITDPSLQEHTIQLSMIDYQWPQGYCNQNSIEGPKKDNLTE